jgi:molybdenum cofactor cytidylyltransferase
VSDQNAAPTRLECSGIVLAAGEARRMGGRVKPLILRDGVPLVRCVVQALSDAGATCVVVVLGHRAEDVAWAVRDLPVRTVVNEAYAAGHGTSLRKGLAILPDVDGPTIVALADQPLLDAADVSALLEAWPRRGAARAVVPRVQGRRGHPVLLDAGAGREILRGDATYGARDWLDERPDEIAWFDSDNVHYIVDVDFPEDLERIAQRYGCALRWPDDF